MSDEIREDTPAEETATGDTLGSETQTDDGAVETPSLIFGKYKDMDAAESGIKSLEQKLHEQAQELASLKEKSDLASAVEKLAKVSETKQSPDDSAERYKAFLAEVAEDFREQPEVGVEKFAQVTNSWIADVENKLGQKYESELTELKQTITGLNEKLGDMNPDYLEHKELVDKMVADGMPKAKAIDWAKQMEPKESRVLPTSMNGNVKRGDDKKSSYLTKEEREALKKNEGLTDEDLDLMEAEAQDRFKRGGKLL